MPRIIFRLITPWLARVRRRARRCTDCGHSAPAGICASCLEVRR